MVDMKQGVLVISLDFELMWGNIESWTTDGYGNTNIAHVRDVFDRLLPLLDKYGVKVTVGTVGLIMQNGVDDGIMPEMTPTYKRAELSPYNGLLDNIDAKDKSLYFAPDIVAKLKASPYIEVGSHTYCHYYCWEDGQTVGQFEADIKKAIETAHDHGITLRSIIFPRNEVNDDYLAVCAKHGFTSYRGNALKYFNHTKTGLEEYRQRLCRLIDAYMNIGGYTSYKLESGNSLLLNIRASRFIRPYSPKLAFLDNLRIRRIRKEMEHAAKNGEVYHLWWHPHNMGAYIDESMGFLEKMLIAFTQCHEKYGMRSITMNELYKALL